jgi:hypothetical protein
MVAKYAEKRAALKAAGDYVALQKLPKTHQKLDFTIVAKLLAVLKDICVISAFLESISEKWQTTV